MKALLVTYLVPLLVAVGCYLLVAAINWFLWWDTEAHWLDFVKRHPKWAKVVVILRYAGPHYRKVLLKVRAWAADRAKAQGLDPAASPALPPTTPPPPPAA